MVVTEMSDPDLTRTLRVWGGPERIQGTLMALLSRQGRFGDSGELEATIIVTGFRLRSQYNAYNWGALAGADYLRVRVEIRRGETLLRTFEMGDSTILGAREYQYEDERLRHLVDGLCYRIVAEMG